MKNLELDEIENLDGGLTTLTCFLVTPVNMTETLNLLLKNPIIIITLIIMIILKVFPPKKANSIYGYRTFRSKKNKLNWDFAQRYCSNLSLKFLIPLFMIQILLYLIYKSTTLIDLSLLACWILSFGIVIYKTEQKLKKM